ncbi:GATA domain-containing protein [Cephalotus follicularis]|uniref:GATA transcription factor n=1 Tax=Cephalotus follicularis TaxID=3775 RepID=A0A1Q3CWG3_CEPFO|nr:GATA domain-containing protein [Cephalotus follicularis]
MHTPCKFLCHSPSHINISIYTPNQNPTPTPSLSLSLSMDMYGLSTPDYFRIDDLLDFSNDEIFTASASIATSTIHMPPPQNPSPPFNVTTLSTDFTDDLCVPPSDDVAELEWLSQFVEDSFSDFPASSLTVRSDTSSTGRSRTKRSKSTANTWTSSKENQRQTPPEGGTRRCTHCASEKTPQWRTGPLGPKTLCNACGVRFKSGRLVPEYRPAASPTFVLTQHSNSHRKVMELRRQKEMTSRQQQEQQMCHRSQQDFEVC